MTQQEARDGAEVMLAFARGQPIESRLRDRDAEWELDDDPSFDFDWVEYRVKRPEPKLREWWILTMGENDHRPCLAYLRHEGACDPGSDGRTLIRAREVLE